MGVDKNIYVFEYVGDWTTGSRVVLCTEEELSTFVENRITDEKDVAVFYFQSKVRMYEGVPKEEAIEAVNTHAPDVIKQELLDILNNDGDDYPGYGEGRVRFDWIYMLTELKEGLYLVDKVSVFDDQTSRLLHDSYNCG